MKNKKHKLDKNHSENTGFLVDAFVTVSYMCQTLNRARQHQLHNNNYNQKRWFCSSWNSWHSTLHHVPKKDNGILCTTLTNSNAFVAATPW